MFQILYQRQRRRILDNKRNENIVQRPCSRGLCEVGLLKKHGCREDQQDTQSL